MHRLWEVWCLACVNAHSPTTPTMQAASAVLFSRVVERNSPGPRLLEVDLYRTRPFAQPLTCHPYLRAGVENLPSWEGRRGNV